MLFFGIKNIWFRIGVFLVPFVWSVLFVYLIYQDFFVADPFNPELSGTIRYGHNGAGDFQRHAGLLLIEFLVLTVVLLPFSFNRFYWVRLLILQAAFGCWLFMLAIAGMHAGGVHALHAVYLLGVNFIIFVLLVATVIAEIVNRRKNRSLQKD